jgi:ribosomal protein S18 acetylase RimI-like enzyme
MNQNSITLRVANPNLDEGRLFARHLDRAAEGFFHFWLGRNTVDIVATAYLQPNHDLSYQNVTFAERDNVIVGMVSGYSAEQHRDSSDRPLKQAAGKFNMRMIVISILFAPLLRIIDTIADGDFYLQAIAVDKEHDGKGVGTALMDSIEDKAIASGSARIVLDVSAKNEGARRLYEHRGWIVESQWPRRIAIPGLRLLRMTKTL